METQIAAPIERCFDLSLSVDLHQASVSGTHERAVAGVMSGVMGLGDTVTWEAVHFGVKQRLTTKITAYERPYRFTDVMTRGVFHRMTHDHEFTRDGAGTLMRDIFTFEAPLGILGRVAETLVLTRYMRKLLVDRNTFLARTAEAGVDAASLWRTPTSRKAGEGI